MSFQPPQHFALPPDYDRRLRNFLRQRWEELEPFIKEKGRIRLYATATVVIGPGATFDYHEHLSPVAKAMDEALDRVIRDLDQQLCCAFARSVKPAGYLSAPPSIG